MKNFALAILLVCSAAFAQVSNQAQLIVAPGAGTASAGQGTFPLTINARGVVAGSYVDSNNNAHGFTWTKTGQIATYDAFGAKSSHTEIAGININGELVGAFIPAQPAFNGQEFGFLLFKSGTYTLIQAAKGAQIATRPVAINDSGVIAGSYVDFSNGQHTSFGFVRDAQGRITTFSAATSNDDTDVVLAINNAGTVVGYYDQDVVTTGDNDQHGFLRDSAGNVTIFDPVGSMGTVPASINTGGQVAGYYTDGNGIQHAFIRNTDATFIVFSIPGATMLSGGVSAIHAVSINDSGETAGQALLSNGTLVGWTRSPSGTIKVLQVCGQTGISALNNAGNFAGSCGAAGEMLNFEGFSL